MKLKSVLFYCSLILFSNCIGQSSAVKEVPLDIVAKDGIKLKATYYTPGKPGPGMILFHQCDNDRKSWSSFAKTLANNGIHVITFDFRGFGESPAAGGMWPNLENDIEAVFNTLIKQPGVNGKIAAGGASCGVEVAITLAKKTNKINALLLLSGPRTNDQVKYFKENKNMVLFTAISDKDDAAESLKKTVMQLNPLNQIIVVKNGPPEAQAHGIGIFNAEPSLLKAGADFIKNALR